MGFLDFIFGNKNAKKKEDLSSFDEYCENCGELLEDCECDDKWLSKQDISQDMDDLEFDEMMDIWDEEDKND